MVLYNVSETFQLKLMFAYAGREFRIVFLSIVRTRHIVEELCKIKISNTAFTLGSPLELTSSSPEDTDEVEASLFNFVDFGFITSIPCFIINFCRTLLNKEYEYYKLITRVFDYVIRDVRTVLLF